MQSFDGYTIHDVLNRAGVPLRSGATLGDGVAVALWERDETADTRYEAPNHHTLSLYLDGGTGIARRDGRRVLRGGGPGSLCVMPQGVTTDWDVSGPVRMLHLYVPRKAFERAVVEGLDADPAAVTLRDDTYVQDALVEGMIRSALLPLRWEEPADRVAASHAARMLVACLATRFTNRAAQAAFARGGLAPAAVRRVREFVEARLDSPLTIDDLAAVAGLSPYHFARAFKRATGEAPHGYVLGRRVERAKAMIAAGRPLAEVAAATGFSSQSHLTARFRERVGVTPLAYAKGVL